MADDVVSRVRFELGQLDGLLSSYAELIGRAGQREPDLVEMTAPASVLHSFYGGLENCFMAVAKSFDGRLPRGRAWHRDLLRRMTEDTEMRSAVLTAAAARRLQAYLSFRHFYRHSYSFVLDWTHLADLVTDLEAAWRATRSELCDFLEGVEHGGQA